KVRPTSYRLYSRRSVTKWSLQASGKRADARREIKDPLRRDVGLLGRLLGQVIAEQGGASLLRDVERLRRMVIAARGSARHEGMAERLVASWSVERAEQVARAFTCYFHLANLAEGHHRARVLRERDSGERLSSESLAATIGHVPRRLGARRLREPVVRLGLVRGVSG